MAGDVGTKGRLIDLGAVILSGNTILQTTIENVIGSDINIGSIDGAGNTLSLDAGLAGAIRVIGTIDDVTTFSITNSSGAEFFGTIGTDFPGSFDINATADGSEIAFQNDVHLTDFTTSD